MSMALLSLAMDFIILLALGGTIYYAMRLSRSLDGFRAHREALKSVVGELTRNIDEAQRAIEGLRNAGKNSAENLDEALRDARRMTEELKMVNATSDGLAGRLEKLAERNRKVAQGMNGPDGFVSADYGLEDPHRPARSGNVETPSFAIQDRDMDGEESGAWEDEAGGGEFSSQAERDLYEALRRNRNKTGGGHF